MSNLRRSARSRNPRHEDETYSGHVNEVTQGVGAMGMDYGGYHHQSDYFSQSQGHQHHYQQQQHHGHHGYYHGGSQQSQEDHSSGRTLRARSGAVQSSSSSTNVTSRGRKRNSSGHQVPPTPGGHLGDDSDDDGNDNDDVVEGTAPASKSKKSQGHHGLEGSNLTVDQMVQNGLYYLLLMQHKKVPVKRSDLIKNAMHSQHNQFDEVMKKLETTLKDVFGMTLVRLEKGKEIAGPGAQKIPEQNPGPSTTSQEASAKSKGKGTSSETYILISKFPSSVTDSVTRRDPEVDSKKTVLYLVLSTIFMLNRAVDEEVIWKIISEMELDQMVCVSKSDLRKFLKMEFVSSGYLTMEQTGTNNPSLAKYSSKSKEHADKPAESNDDVVAAKYSWGPRAHFEYSKYSMLKFVTNRFPGRRPYEFTHQYSMLSKEEKALAEKDLGDGRESDADNTENSASGGDNGSALNVKSKRGGRGETFSIDGENTETEIEADN